MTRADLAEVPISEEADVVLAGRRAKAVLADLEFDEPAVEEIVLVVHELASNIVKHAGEGTLTIDHSSDAERSGIEIRASDSGPGIADVDKAVVDGYSTAGSLGGGLGTIHRHMDEVVVKSDEAGESGLQVVARRSSGTAPSISRTVPPRVGAVTRPKPGYEQNGDAFLVEHGRDQTLVGVIDGLGHGEEARRASSAAQEYVRRHSSEPIADLFTGVERACRPTRGVVMALARFDWPDDHVTVGSVGNITVRVCHSPDPRHLVTRRGVLGGNAPDPLVADWQWDSTSVMVLHSDGLSSRWDCDQFALREDLSVTEAANEILRTLSKDDDDATVLVVAGVER